MWEPVAQHIADNKNFVLTTHINPEGDAIGSEIALAAFLRNLGKNVTIVNSSPTPENCLFLDLTGDIKVYPEAYEPSVLEQADAVLIVDVNNWSHVGPFGEEVKKYDKPRICIDHHEGADPDFADVVVSDTTAAAAGILIYELIRHMKGEFTPAIVDALYTAIITDTGTFRFSNTDRRVFLAAADLYEMGAKPFVLHRKVFAKRWSAARLAGATLATLDSTADGKIAWIHVTQSMFNKAGAKYEDSDGLLDVVRAIGGVELCLFFKENPDGTIKVSLRSNGNLDAFAIASRHGGGGHRMAAGLSVDGPMDRAIQMLVAESVKSLPPGG
ncbi:MAG: bifunctional oligoribonuclease/PAP phosphatase NrnA [Candidatus Latescibacterota bacterium]|nr:MAG: bifunctional oligoribonuclease/PAP phosphatase NrnA [Candidatus Latescibacterota bacterium]